jgi:hypothetical protein
MPFPENTPTPNDLPSLSAAEIAALPVELLAVLQHEIDARLKRDKTAKARFDAGLAVRYAERAAEERQAAGKDTGTTRFDDGDFTIVADLPKRVDWDQDELTAMWSAFVTPVTPPRNMSTSPSRCRSANTPPGPTTSASNLNLRAPSGRAR